MRWWQGALLGLPVVAPIYSQAQEVVGQRLFADQLVVSEPFVEDELALPSILHLHRVRAAGDPVNGLTNVQGELKKRITSAIELSLAGGFTLLDRGEAGTITGFDNLEIGLKYEVLRNELHEAVASMEVQWEVGGTGRAAIGAASSDTISPAILVGKGLGDLPERFGWFRPFALASSMGLLIPVDRRPLALVWGGVLEYSLPYVESFVRPIDLPPPLNKFVPIAELDLHANLQGRVAGEVRGTVNPGVVWVGAALQVGVEAVAPVNARSGVGVRAFLRIPLETTFGDRAGRPIFDTR